MDKESTIFQQIRSILPQSSHEVQGLYCVTDAGCNREMDSVPQWVVDLAGPAVCDGVITLFPERIRIYTESL
ncbi:MAG: hypothetical protein ACLPVO_18885 [Desulfomonilaceae bacterium]